MSLLLLFTGSVFASNANELINEGIKLHDAGKYEASAEKYKQALKLEPDNYLALYELAFSYMVSKKNEKCISVAKKGLNSKSKLKKRFSVPLGSCYSQLGQSKKAIKAFEQGLKIDPKDAYLHLNIAVTLAGIKQDKKAISHLKEAIKYSNGYASPYYFIAELYRTNNYRIPAMFFYMQFILLEQKSRRSQGAARKIYTLLYQNIDQENEGKMTIFVDPNTPTDEGDFSSLELALSFIASTSNSEKNKKSRPDVARHTDALTSFIKICSELDDEQLNKTFTWKHAAKNMISLQNSSDFNTYAYTLATEADIKGAKDWFNKNITKVNKASNAINKLHMK